jgi:hypothetical protein
MNKKKFKRMPVILKGTLFFSLAALALFISNCTKKEAPALENEMSSIEKKMPSITAATSSRPYIWVNDLPGESGNDNIEDTWAFQKAIDSMAKFPGGGDVYAKPGKYYINADSAIRMKSHVYLHLGDSSTQLIAKPTANERYQIIRVVNNTDVIIDGGKLVGDRDTHLGTTGEHGMGIAVYSGSHVNIIRTVIRNCWGDGIAVGSLSLYGAHDPSRVILIKHVISDNNRRQALTIGHANGVTVDSSTFTNTNGTAPQDGIDIEPDSDTAQNITIKHCEIAYNHGQGVEEYVNSSSVVQNVTIQDNYIHDNHGHPGWFTRCHDSNCTYNRMINNTYNTIHTDNTVNCVFTPNTYQ